MTTISKEFAKKVMLLGYYDTKKYRYVWFDCAGGIFRYPVEYVGTTEALDWANYEKVTVR